MFQDIDKQNRQKISSKQLLEYITSKRKLLNLNDNREIANILKNPQPLEKDERLEEFYIKIGVTKEESDAVGFSNLTSLEIQKILGQD